MVVPVQPDPTEANRFVLVGLPVYVTTQIPADDGADSNESRIVLANMSQATVGRDQEVTVTLVSGALRRLRPDRHPRHGGFDIGLLNAPGIVVLGGAPRNGARTEAGPHQPLRRTRGEVPRRPRQAATACLTAATTTAWLYAEVAPI